MLPRSNSGLMFHQLNARAYMNGHEGDLLCWWKCSCNVVFFRTIFIKNTWFRKHVTEPSAVLCFVRREFFRSPHCLRCLSALELCCSSQRDIWNENAGSHQLARVPLIMIDLWEGRELQLQVTMKQEGSKSVNITDCSLLSNQGLDGNLICRSRQIET